MNISYKQSQMELFPGKDAAAQEAQKPKFLLTHLTLTLENLVIFGIVGIMITVLTFSLGVERGKRIALAGDGASESVATALPKTERIKVEPVDQEVVASVAQPSEVVIPVNIEPPVPEVVAAPAVPDNAYTIQVASFKKAQHAEEEAQLLEKMGVQIYVLPKGEYSIVCVGKFEAHKEAQSFARKLKDKYKDYLIRRL